MVVPFAWFCTHGVFLLSYFVKRSLCKILVSSASPYELQQRTVRSKAQEKASSRNNEGAGGTRVNVHMCLATESGGGEGGMWQKMSCE